MANEDLRSGEDLTVLVLDDDDENRVLTKDLIQAEAARVVEAQDAASAERELIAHPGIDCVSVDISLRGGGRDQDGASVAVRLREANPGIPIIGYSAYFGENDLSAEARSAFTDFFQRAGDVGDISDYIDRCLDEGRRYREARRTAFSAQFNAMVEAGTLGERECSILRTFSPAAEEEYSIEGALVEAGYGIQVVLPRPRAGVRLVTQRPFVVWVRQVDDESEFEAEVFGQPTLYGVGESGETAVKNLVEVFWLFFDELRNTDRLDLEGPALSLAHFYEHVLGEL